jgi:hypothetical protein
MRQANAKTPEQIVKRFAADTEAVPERMRHNLCTPRRAASKKIYLWLMSSKK